MAPSENFFKPLPFKPHSLKTWQWCRWLVLVTLCLAPDNWTEKLNPARVVGTDEWRGKGSQNPGVGNCLPSSCRPSGQPKCVIFSLSVLPSSFLPVFDLMLESLMTIQVEPHQCPLHQSILLIHGPIHEKMAKIFSRIGGFENLSFFWVGHFDFLFFQTNFFLLHSHENQSKFIG